MSTAICVPTVIVEGRQLSCISAAGPRRQAERACAQLAKSYRVVLLQSHPQGKPEQSECLATWRDGRRVS